MIVGALSKEQFAKRMAQTKRAKALERRAENARRFMSEKPLAVACQGLVLELRAEREEATKKGLSRRQTNGRWISRKEQAEAIASAEDLTRRGF